MTRQISIEIRYGVVLTSVRAALYELAVIRKLNDIYPGCEVDIAPAEAYRTTVWVEGEANEEMARRVTDIQRRVWEEYCYDLPAKRMKWIRQADGSQVSADGRFRIRLTCQNPNWWGYQSLTDLTTGEEFPCRTEQSAKTGARNIAQKGHRQ